MAVIVGPAAIPERAAAHDARPEPKAVEIAAARTVAAPSRSAAATSSSAPAPAGRLRRSAQRQGRSQADHNRWLARGLVERRWGSPRQYRCLDRLWTRESGWNHRASNPRSGAYGIPQALPAAKMASSGTDWRTNPHTQIKWGLSYIKNRYGTPCRAWEHFRSTNWY